MGTVPVGRVAIRTSRVAIRAWQSSSRSRARAPLLQPDLLVDRGVMWLAPVVAIAVSYSERVVQARMNAWLVAFVGWLVLVTLLAGLPRGTFMLLLLCGTIGPGGAVGTRDRDRTRPAHGVRFAGHGFSRGMPRALEPGARDRSAVCGNVARRVRSEGHARLHGGAAAGAVRRLLPSPPAWAGSYMLLAVGGLALFGARSVSAIGALLSRAGGVRRGRAARRRAAHFELARSSLCSSSSSSPSWPCCRMSSTDSDAIRRSPAERWSGRRSGRRPPRQHVRARRGRVLVRCEVRRRRSTRWNSDSTSVRARRTMVHSRRSWTVASPRWRSWRARVRGDSTRAARLPQGCSWPLLVLVLAFMATTTERGLYRAPMLFVVAAVVSAPTLAATRRVTRARIRRRVAGGMVTSAAATRGPDGAVARLSTPRGPETTQPYGHDRRRPRTRQSS